MIINATTIADGASTQQGLVTIDPARHDDISFAESVQVTAQIDRSIERLTVQVTYSAVAQVVCSRCLAAFNSDVAGDFYLVLDYSEEKGLSILDGEEYEDCFVDEEKQELDISRIVADEILLTFPMIPVCKGSCKGALVDKKEVVVEKAIDPRWEALKKLTSNN